MKNTVLSELYSKLSESNNFKTLLITVLVILVVLLVYFTGGIANSYSHLIYIPIILSAYFWGYKGGTVTAIISGVLIGPYMPISVSGGIMQTTSNWVFRIVILAFVGFITGYFFEKINRLNEIAKEGYLTSPLTGANNINRLIDNLDKRIENKEKFAIASIKLTNIEQMTKYIKHSIAEDLSKELVNELSNIYGKETIYSKGYDEIYILFPLDSAYLEECELISKKYSAGLKVNQFTFRIHMKIGIYEYHGVDETSVEIYNKARIAYEQGEIYQSGIYLYNKRFEQNRKEYLEISGSLHEAIINNKLYLVYQPKINTAENKISGVEVLCRWDRAGKEPIEAEVFTKIAEDTGVINEISRFVLDNSFSQILDWNKKGIILDFSINASSRELLESHFEDWEKKVTESDKVIISKLAIEITERTISENSDEVIERINELRSKGIKISIDDFGTGVNSLVRVTQIPYDQLKIDRYFIVNINKLEIREVIKKIINYAHKFGKEVVAEGVETEEQLNILKELGCDIIQGYYYSKPLLAKDFEKYYYNFTI